MARAPDDDKLAGDDLITRAFDSPHPGSIVIGHHRLATAVSDIPVKSSSSDEESDAHEMSHDDAAALAALRELNLARQRRCARSNADASKSAIIIDQGKLARHLATDYDPINNFEDFKDYRSRNLQDFTGYRTDDSDRSWGDGDFDLPDDEKMGPDPPEHPIWSYMAAPAVGPPVPLKLL